MLTFLRHIRKSLLTSGAARKYIFYAIGEIALFVIGILIALQINNWNQNRIERNSELVLVNTLYNELLQNISYTEERIAALEKLQRNCVSFLEYFIPDPADMPLDTFIIKYNGAVGIGFYAPKVSSFNRTVNNEEFNLIRFDSLKYLLNAYKTQLELTAINYELLSRTLTDSDWGVTNQPGFRNILWNLDKGSRFWSISSDLGLELSKSKIAGYSATKVFTNIELESFLSRNLARQQALRKNLTSLQEITLQIKDYIEQNYHLH